MKDCSRQSRGILWFTVTKAAVRSRSKRMETFCYEIIHYFYALLLCHFLKLYWNLSRTLFSFKKNTSNSLYTTFPQILTGKCRSETRNCLPPRLFFFSKSFIIAVLIESGKIPDSKEQFAIFKTSWSEGSKTSGKMILQNSTLLILYLENFPKGCYWYFCQVLTDKRFCL